ANELPGIADRGVQAGRVPRHGDPLGDRGDGLLAAGPALEELAHGVGHEGRGDGPRSGHTALGAGGGQARPESRDAIGLQGAEAWRLAVLREPYELHGTPPKAEMWEGLYSATRS